MAKKKVKNKKPSQRWKKYRISGGTLEKEKSCPRCGQGTFMAKHSDRYYCGCCKYTEFIRK